jgi:peptide-methionine (S)-S-oxide reductase
MGKTEVAIFGMGCFWGPELLFSKVKGVKKTEVGYMGGEETGEVRYEEVGKKGHAEVVRIEFDSEQVSYSDLLNLFWENHDPTTINRQGLDIGKQYRSVIFFMDDSQKKAAKKSLKEKEKEIDGDIVTLIEKAGKFYRAEEYHQKYMVKNEGAVC